MDRFVPFWWTQTKSSLTCICKAIAAPISSLSQRSSTKRFSLLLFTCRSIYPSSVLESLEYLTLLLGMPADRFILDDIITMMLGNQLEPGKQK